MTLTSSSAQLLAGKAVQRDKIILRAEPVGPLSEKSFLYYWLRNEWHPLPLRVEDFMEDDWEEVP